MKLGEKLAALRKQRGLSQMDAAEALGVSRQAVSRWEVGASSPGTDNLLALSKLYGVSLDTLVGDAEPGAAPEAEPKAPGAETAPGTQEAEAQLARYRRLSKWLGAALAAVLLVAALLVGLYWGRHNAPPTDRTEEGIPIVDIEDLEGRRIDLETVLIGPTS